MFLDFYDKQNKYLGVMNVTNRYNIYCFDEQQNFIGRLFEYGEHIIAYNADNDYMGRFNGKITFDKNNQIMGYGNLIYNIFYPTIAKIR